MYGAATSPILAGGQLILQRDGDSTNSQLVALAPATGRTLWESPRPLSGSCSSTPMVLHHDGLDELIVQGKRFLRDGAMWTPIDPATGRRLIDRERLGIGGQFSASPIAANGFIYAVNTSGTFAVFRSSDTLEIVAVNALAENVRCTPAIAGNRIYVRSTQHLWAFGQ